MEERCSGGTAAFPDRQVAPTHGRETVERVDHRSREARGVADERTDAEGLVTLHGNVEDPSRLLHGVA